VVDVDTDDVVDTLVTELTEVVLLVVVITQGHCS
jgi:hypothetical protein